jgi:P-type Ca2+ transporter type 2C
MIAYHGASQDVVTELGSDAQAGLREQDARQRLDRYGRNELQAEQPTPAWKKFLAQFQNVLVLLLLAASVISGGLWFYERDSALPYEALAILAVVLLNAILGYVQEARAASAVAALRQLAAAQAHVLRDGERKRVDATDVVPGDILLIEEGDTIAADARLIQAVALHAAESALTGESVPVAKDASPISGEVELGDRHNMVFSGTAATSGRGKAVVVATGMQTELGRIAGLLKETHAETTPLQVELDRVGKLLGLVVVVIAIVMIGTILVVEDVHGFTAIFDVLILGVALAVAAVPEGLPAVVTAVLSLGVQRAARRNAIVRHLSAVETLGSANVIASDKTGTLTRNEMTVRVVVTASGRVRFGGTGYAPEGAVTREGGGAIDGAFQIELERTLAAADRASNAVLQEHDGRCTVQGDPTEGALIVAARKAGVAGAALDARFGRLAELPFSSERKLMSTIHSDAQRPELVLALTKGAPDVLLARCTGELVGEVVRPLDANRRAELANLNEQLAGEALRTLAAAYRSWPRAAFEAEVIDDRVEAELVFLGLIGMIDPPREEAKPAVARTRAAGIRPIMITGDHPRTAAVIAVELGIADDGRALTGAELEQLSDEALDSAVREVSVYARVNPEHKLRIVRALQRGGAIVAMTGDGVNDAPALKTADIGIAMGITGTDVSKQAADMVLADDNFATIVAAVEEGRAIYANIRKFLRYLLASNIGEVMTMFFGVVFAIPLGLAAAADGGVVLPLLATQLLWINLVTDGAPALALGLEPADPGIMNQPPRPRTEGVITRRMWAGIFFVGVITAAGTLLVLDASLPGGLIEGRGSMRYAQTMAFTTLVFFSLFTLFTARSDTRSAFSGMFANKWLWSAALLALVLQSCVIYIPVLQRAFSTVALGLEDWLCCMAVGSSALWLRELSKLLGRARAGRTPAG